MLHGRSLAAFVAIQPFVTQPLSAGPLDRPAFVLQAFNGQHRPGQQTRKADRAKNPSRAAAGTNTNQGNQLLEAGDYKRAVEFYRRAIELEPANARTFYNLSLALARLGDRAAERDALEKAVAVDPNLAPAHNQLGLIHMAEGRASSAE